MCQEDLCRTLTNLDIILKSEIILQNSAIIQCCRIESAMILQDAATIQCCMIESAMILKNSATAVAKGNVN